MDDMTWMSSFYQPVLQPSTRRRWPAFWIAAALLATAVCGGVMLSAWR